jgi:hypothetical protein
VCRQVSTHLLKSCCLIELLLLRLNGCIFCCLDFLLLNRNDLRNFLLLILYIFILLLVVTGIIQFLLSVSICSVNVFRIVILKCSGGLLVRSLVRIYECWLRLGAYLRLCLKS